MMVVHFDRLKPCSHVESQINGRPRADQLEPCHQKIPEVQGYEVELVDSDTEAVEESDNQPVETDVMPRRYPQRLRRPPETISLRHTLNMRTYSFRRRCYVVHVTYVTYVLYAQIILLLHCTLVPTTCHISSRTFSMFIYISPVYCDSKRVQSVTLTCCSITQLA